MSTESAEATAADSGILEKTYRSIGPRFGAHPDAEMNSIGWAIFLGVVVLLLPLLPILVVVWLLERVFRAIAGRRGT